MLLHTDPVATEKVVVDEVVLIILICVVLGGISPLSKAA
jgi:hypothetical protein